MNLLWFGLLFVFINPRKMKTIFQFEIGKNNAGNVNFFLLYPFT